MPDEAVELDGEAVVSATDASTGLEDVETSASVVVEKTASGRLL